MVAFGFHPHHFFTCLLTIDTCARISGSFLQVLVNIPQMQGHAGKARSLFGQLPSQAGRGKTWNCCLCHSHVAQRFAVSACMWKVACPVGGGKLAWQSYPKFLLPWNCCSESCSHDGSLLSSSNVSLSTAMLMLGSRTSSDVGGYGFISANSISPSPRCNSPFSPVKVPKYFLDSPLFCGFLRFPRPVLFPTMLLGMHKRPECRQAEWKTTCFF